MPKIVIDIVLLPDENAQRVCRNVNENIGGKIDFINTGKVPHISLLMGAVDEEKISEISGILNEMSKKYSPIIAQSILRNYTIGDTGEDGYSFELEEHKDVNSLFEYIAENIRPMLEYDNISTDMFYMGEEVEKVSMKWVKGFKKRTVQEYSSHITLGIGKLKGNNPDVFRFGADKIAIYQLGNYCTCDNQLFEISL